MRDSRFSITWSPCGRFIAAQTKKAVEIRDSLTFELLSVLQSTQNITQLMGSLAYSPDGHFIASPSSTGILVWDIQTGGVAKTFQCHMIEDTSLAWSLNGEMIGTLIGVWAGYCADIYNTYSSRKWSPGEFFAQDTSDIWAHNEFFRVLTKPGVGGDINILEVGHTLTTVESFHIHAEGYNYSIKSYSPTTYRISALTCGSCCRLVILDIQDLGELLDEAGEFESHHFSSDGSLFAASIRSWVHIWKFESSCYIPWRKFLTGFHTSSNLHFRFSPTLTSVLVRFQDTLRLLRLDGPSDTLTTHRKQLTIISHSGTYIVTAHHQESTITIINLLSQTPSQFIDTDIEITKLELTKNVLLVVGSGVVVAWLLTEVGLVDNVLGSRRAVWGDRIWIVETPEPHSRHLAFSVEGRIGVIKSNQTILHTYSIRTGRVIKSTREPQAPWYSLEDIPQTQNRLHDNSMDDPPPNADWRPLPTKEGWVKDCEGKHLLWLPIEWRQMGYGIEGWAPKIATVQLISPQLKSIIIKLY
jgi:WD40 repeat protein